MPPCIAQQRRHSAIAITTILPRQRYDILGERRFVIRPAGRLALCRSMLPEHAADPPLGHRHHRSDVIDTAPSARGAQKFPRAASCNISLSSVRSDIARRSRWFSRSEEHTYELQSLMRISYAVFCLTTKTTELAYQQLTKTSQN